ncbi:MAG: ATP-dependent DNA helicase RecG [Clostridiales bacterium]|nr:ATP-dependent DNA helicase RecG [Clostridiales bacterium]
MDINTNIQYLKGVGGKRAELFNKLGIYTVDALLHFYPRAYEDWSAVVPIKEAPIGENCSVRARVSYEPTKTRSKGGMFYYTTTVTDGVGLMNIIIFNNKYAAAKLQEGEEFIFWGKVSIGSRGERQMLSPLIETVTTGERIRPVYKLTQGLTQKVVENAVNNALKEFVPTLEETLPKTIRSKYKLCNLGYAMSNIHNPSSSEALKLARERLIFEELFILQLGLMRLKGREKRTSACVVANDFSEEFYKGLPFTPTNAQKRAVSEAVADMQKNVPMARLVQGDVGSGKTLVAATLVYNTAKNNMQSAFMAPTEILALQHFKTMHKFFEDSDIKVEVLTGSTPASRKKEIKKALADGEIDLIIGTHALIQDDVLFKSLALVITDEQHRFGVKQRSALAEKGNNPHTLVMSATPIPRTLALMIYGDLDVSVLDELPPGRQPIETYSVTSKLHDRVYNYIRKHLDEGRQGYIVCPLVEEGETELIPAVEYSEQLQKKEFRGYRVGLLHGKMKPSEKEQVMQEFSEGKIQILVSTTVVEVGVDVPNAVIMVIENAERFGLSQLHQLRGRVGRGKYKSTCILISDAQNEQARTRLKAMCDTCDGFKIADEDLKLRGPGDFFGARQHGLPELKIADMLNDMQILNSAQQAAKSILKSDEKLEKSENISIKKSVEKLFSTVGEAGLN